MDKGSNVLKPIILASILLILFCLRTIPTLAVQSLWGDEGWSVDFTNGDSPRAVLVKLSTDRHPPFYFLLLDGWREVAGEDEIALRWLAVLGSLLTGACIFQLGQTLWKTEAGLAALFFFVMLDKQGDLSREVRHYTWLMFWGTASAWLLIVWLRSGRFSFFYVLTLIAGLYTHSFMFVLLLIQGIYAFSLLRFSRQMGRLVFLWLLAGIAFLPWGLVFWHQYVVQGALRHDLPVSSETLQWLSRDFLGAPLTLFLGLMVLGLWKAPKSATYYPTLALGLPLLLIFGLPYLSDSLKFLTDRNLSIIIPATALLVGYGIVSFEGFPRHALLAFLLIHGGLTLDAHQVNPPWRLVSHWIAAYQVAGQPVISDIGGAGAALDYHLRQELDPHIRHTSIWNLTEDPRLEPMSALYFEGIAESSGFWYVFWDNDPTFLNTLGGWGYVQTAHEQTSHENSPIHLYRFDLATLQTETLAEFGNALRLHRVVVQSQGEDWQVLLWWSATEQIFTDYTISVFVRNGAGQLISQVDEQPHFAPMSAWEAHTLVFDGHHLPKAEGELGIKVYNGDEILFLANGDEFWRWDG